VGISIAAGAGLLLGLVLLVWALGERSKRHAAQRAVDAAEKLRNEAVDTASHNAARAAEMEDQALRLSKQVETFRSRLTDIRTAVAKKAPIKTIAELLRTESDEEVI
jgi:predicted ATP-grasp superfamily ATP-dependent carboligase